jgi:DNA-binding IclR family transcriptional regulator
MQLPVHQALLLAVFHSARAGRRANLTSFCQRSRTSVATLQRAFDQLERLGLVSFLPEGERLTLEGLALAAALSRKARRQARPIASCRSLAA